MLSLDKKHLAFKLRCRHIASLLLPCFTLQRIGVGKPHFILNEPLPLL